MLILSKTFCRNVFFLFFFYMFVWLKVQKNYNVTLANISLLNQLLVDVWKHHCHTSKLIILLWNQSRQILLRAFIKSDSWYGTFCKWLLPIGFGYNAIPFKANQSIQDWHMLLFNLPSVLKVLITNINLRCNEK